MVHLPLLEKNRYISEVLHKTGHHLDLNQLVKTLKNVINANTYILNYEGVLLGYSLIKETGCEHMKKNILRKGYLLKKFNDFLVNSDILRYNLRNEDDKCIFLEDVYCVFNQKAFTVLPIMGEVSGDEKRLGTLLLVRFDRDFNEEDLILSERGAAVIGMELFRRKVEESEAEKRNKDVVYLAAGNLSMTEARAVQYVLRELEGGDGMLVTTNAALELGMDRSVIIKALHKLKTGAIVESRSLGMKGTYIKVLNSFLYEYMGVSKKKTMGEESARHVQG